MKRAFCSLALLAMLGCGGEDPHAAETRPAPVSRWHRLAQRSDFDGWLAEVYVTCDGADKVYVLIGSDRGQIAVSRGACPAEESR